MIPNVEILVTARNPELLPYSLLVFDSLRIGFPTAKVHVTGNALPEFALQQVKDACTLAGASFENGLETIHHVFIEDLFRKETEPFWILDTDVCLFDTMESLGISADTPLCGQRIPEFLDEVSGCLTRSRLHTSLLYINPAEVKRRLQNFTSPILDSPFTPIANLIYPLVVPFNGRGVFYDTMSQLYHATGGLAFTEEIMDKYFHFHYGCFSDVVLSRLNGAAESMKKARDFVLENPVRGKGAWRLQQEYFAMRQGAK